MASNICELFLWQDKGNLFWRGNTFDGMLHWMPQCGGKYGMLWFLSTKNVFVLQATQNINSPNLEASRLLVHFLQHVKLHVFGEDVFWRNTDFSNLIVWYRKTERATSKFLPWMFRAWMRVYKQNTINHSFHLILELSRWIRRGHFLTEYSTKFQINGAYYQSIKYFQSF